MRNTRRLVLIAIIGGVLLALVLTLNKFGDAARQPAGNAAPANVASPASENPFIAAAGDVVASDSTIETMSRSEAALQIILRLLFAVILSGVLAFRPRSD